MRPNQGWKESGTSLKMESIAELRNICQTTSKKDKSNVYMRYVCRFLSIYMTRAILPTAITANQVSVAMIAMGFISGIFFLSPMPGTFAVGAVLLQLWYLLDCMDGEVARYRHYKTTGSVIIDKRESSLTGLYYDMINHYIVNFWVPSSISFGLFLKTGNHNWILIGMLGALTQVLMLAMHDAKSRAILTHLKKYSRVQPVKEKAGESGGKDRSPAHLAFIILHYSMTYPSVMNLVGIAAILNIFSGTFDWRFPVLLYICFGTAVVSSVLITRILRNQLVDKELRSSFELIDLPKEAAQVP